MRRTLGIALLAIPLGGLLGCIENPPPVTPAVATVAAPVAPAAPAVDLSPVAEPADIFLTARWKNPDATLAGLTACAGIPGPIAESAARQLVDKGLANAFRGGVDGRQIAEAVALDAPVDLLVSLDQGRRGQPQALFAFSIPLTSLDRVKATLEAAGPLVEIAPGLWRVGVKEAGDLSCAIGPAAGTAPARLICGQHDKDVVTLGPYLARNMPVTAPPAQDLHAELRFVPIDARYGADIRRGLGFLPSAARSQAIGEPRFDRALDEAAGALADEGAALASDLDRVTFDLGVAPGTCLSATTALELRGQTSWLAGTIAESAANAGPPPAIFWRAPRDSDSASYGRASDVSRYDGILRTLRGLLVGKLAQEKVGSEADRTALAALVASPFHKGTSIVIASGHRPRRPCAARRGAVAAADGRRRDERLPRVDPPRLRRGARGAREAAQGRGRGLRHEGARRSPAQGARRRGRVPARREARPRARGARPGRARSGAQVRTIEKKKPVRLHPPRAAHGRRQEHPGSPRRQPRRARQAPARRPKSGAPDTGTLAARPGLEPLRSGQGRLQRLRHPRDAHAEHLQRLATSPAVSAAPSSPTLADTLSNLPHKGETPIFVTSKVAARAPARAASSPSSMQKGSFEDVGAILLTSSASPPTRPARPCTALIPTEQPAAHPSRYAPCHPRDQTPERGDDERTDERPEAAPATRPAPHAPPGLPPVPPAGRAERPTPSEPEALTAEQLAELRAIARGSAAPSSSPASTAAASEDRDAGREVGDEMDEANTEGVDRDGVQAPRARRAASCREIDRALAKMTEATYGLCEGTGEPIGYSRLKLRPWARFSVEYQEELERAERGRGGV